MTAGAGGRAGGTAGVAGAQSLAELERRAAERGAGSGYGYGRDALVVCDRVVRIFTAEDVEVQALQGVDLLVERGELTALVGASAAASRRC